MKKYFILCLLISSSAFSGTKEYTPSKKDLLVRKLEYDAAYEHTLDSAPYYKQAYQILDDRRLLTLTARRCMKNQEPVGLLKEKNMFHYFWNISMNNLLDLAETSQNSNDHPSIYGPEHATVKNNIIDQRFYRKLKVLKGVLWSDLNYETHTEKVDKVPSYAEVLLLDYVQAQLSGLNKRFETHPGVKGVSFDYFYCGTSCEKVLFEQVGKSIAYKVSSPETFAKFAATPFIKYISEATTGPNTFSFKKRLLSEIVLGFLIDHARDDVRILENVESEIDLKVLINKYDTLDFLREMRSTDVIARSFEFFLSYLKKSPYVAHELDEIRKTLDVQF